MEAAKNLFDAYQRAESLIEQGQLAQAADLCRLMLEDNPNYPYGYHLMATLFSATGTFERALTFAQMATQMAPDICAFHLQKGQLLYSLGDYEQAALAFTSALNIEPRNPVILLLLANTFTRRGLFAEARGLFLRARELSDIPEMDEQEGLCNLLQGNLREAEALFDRLIARSPDYPWGHIHKGRLLMDAQQHAPAEASMARAHKLAPQLFEPIYALAVLNDRQGQAEIAIRYAMEAIRIKPMAWECHVYLGSLLLKERHFTEAEQVLRQALSLRPQCAYALQLYIRCMAALKQPEKATEYVRQALALNPANDMLNYALAVASGNQPPAHMAAYYASFYDGYAEHYDHHQRNVICGKAHEQLAKAILHSPALSAPPRRLLDMGCGTGLVGQALSDAASSRTGVDISPRMLEKARHKQVYHALHLNEATEFMLASDNQYDMVTAAGLLPCMGDLSAFLQAARNVLAPGGLLAFTIEKDETATAYRLRATGHYSHNPAYVTGLLAAKGYVIIHQEEATLHLEDYTPVTGMVVIARKTQTH